MTHMSNDRTLTIEEIDALESPVGADGRGGLLEARQALDQRWESGHRDVETARRRAFLYWWGHVEPDFLTGLPEGVGLDQFLAMHAWLMSQPIVDSETRFVLGWMLKKFAGWVAPDLESEGQVLWAEQASAKPVPDLKFDFRTEYGRYFRHILEGLRDGARLTPEVEYQQFVHAFGPEPGVLPDGRVFGSAQGDWPAVFEMLGSSGWDIRIGDVKVPSPGRFDPPQNQVFSVRPSPELQINFFYFEGEILFDLDLGEFDNQRAADGLVVVMRRLGGRLGRDVEIVSEGSDGPPVLKYSVESDTFTL